MKRRVLAIVLMLVMGLGVMASCGKKTEKTTKKDVFPGNYMDELSERASLEINKNADGTYAALVDWPNSASEVEEWSMTLIESDGKLVYSDGKHERLVFSESGEQNSLNTLEENLVGSFKFNDDNKLEWADGKGEVLGVFVKD